MAMERSGSVGQADAAAPQPAVEVILRGHFDRLLRHLDEQQETLLAQLTSKQPSTAPQGSSSRPVSPVLMPRAAPRAIKPYGSGQSHGFDRAGILSKASEGSAEASHKTDLGMNHMKSDGTISSLESMRRSRGRSPGVMFGPMRVTREVSQEDQEVSIEGGTPNNSVPVIKLYQDEEDNLRRIGAEEYAKQDAERMRHTPRSSRRSQRSQRSRISHTSLHTSVRSSMHSNDKANLGLDEGGVCSCLFDIQHAVHNLVRRQRFEYVSAALILTNSILFGIQVECNAADVGDRLLLLFTLIQDFYAFCFLVELVMRVVADGRFFFHVQHPDVAWNYLDLCVVGSSIVEAVLDTLTLFGSSELDGRESSESPDNMRLLRVVRIVRIMRVMRVLKILRFVHALRTLVYSILCTMRSLFWAMLLLMIILYMFGILFTQAAVDHLKTEDTVPDNLSDYWDSVLKSMFTLFKVITGGVTWEVAAKPLGIVGATWLFAFIVYVVFALFAVTNVITAVFCQSAIESAQHDFDFIVQSHLNEVRMYNQKTEQLFYEADVNHSGVLDIKEFESYLQDDRVRAYFASLELDTQDAWTLFKLLDTDQNNCIDLGEFLRGCFRLRGSARAVELAKLEEENKKSRRRLEGFFEFAEAALTVIAQDRGLELQQWSRPCASTSTIRMSG